MFSDWVFCLFSTSLIGISICDERVFDHCWAGKKLSDTKYALCPLIAENKTHSTESSCGITLSTESPSMAHANKICRRCLWKEREDGVCHPTKNYNIRECCCKQSLCNKKLYEDGLPGWTVKDGDFDWEPRYNGTCVSANFVYDPLPDTPQWSNLSFELDCKQQTFSSNYSDQCMTHYTMSGKTLISMQMGCANDFCLENDANAQREFTAHSDTCYRREDKATGNTQFTCCCRGNGCNAKLYRKYAFGPITDRRFEEEKEYIQLLKSAKKSLPKTWWSKNPDYYAMKPYIDGGVLMFCVLYTLLICFLYQYYRPIDMEKRVNQYDMSKEL